MLTKDEKYMKMAVKLAKKAASMGEVPIGCVIVYEDKVIGRGYNRRKTDKNTLSHAEITAIRKAVYEDLMTNCENLIEYSCDMATGKSQLGPSCRRASLLIPLSRKLIRGAMKHI